MKLDGFEKVGSVDIGKTADIVSHFLFDEGKPTETYSKEDWENTLKEVKNGREGVKTHWIVAGALATLCALPAIVRNFGETMASNPKMVKAIGAVYLGLTLLGIANTEVKAMAIDDDKDGDDLGDDSGIDNSHGQFYIGAETHKNPSYIVLDPEEKASFDLGPTTRIVESFGLADVDRVVEVPYVLQPAGSDADAIKSNLKLEYVAAGLTLDSTQEATGFTFLPTGMVAIEFQDTNFVQVSPAENNGRGGVTHGNVIDSSSIIVGRESNSGQLFAVMAVDGSGNLTGVKTGLESLESLPMEFGPIGTNLESSLGVWVGGSFEPLINTDGTIFIPTDDIDVKPMIPAGSVDIGLLKDYIPPQYANVNTMFNEHDYVINSEDGTVSRDGVAVSGFRVDRNGNMTVEVDGEQVSVEMTDIELDGDEGMRVNGKIYDADTDSWIEYVSPVLSTEAGLATQAILDQIGVPEGVVELQMKGDDVVCIDVATGEVACKNGEFAAKFAKEYAKLYGDAKATPYGPKTGNVPSGTATDEVKNYVTFPLNTKVRGFLEKKNDGVDVFTKEGTVYTSIMLDDSNKSWAVIITIDKHDPDSDKYFAYENESDELVVILLK